ncbi:MAG: M20/M25/M40 family metallo-hydrolase [Bryobacteraceae bacterium]|jgi:acetylornithine deacetylase/succinyl-diaminopimelate desuccinylase-like protein
MAANIVQTGIDLGGLAGHRGVRECLRWFTREKRWVNEIHLQLCRVPAPTFLEGERATWFVEQFRALGWDASLDSAGNAIAIEGRPPYMALTAHLDTVIAPRGPDDIAVEPDGRLTGPGVADNGAGLAAMLAIARAWKSCSGRPELRHGLMLAANTAEEGEGNLAGMRRLAKGSPLARDIKAFLVVDGADIEHITTRALGSRRFEIAFTGPGGHSWSDYGVGNPLHALCRAVALFADTRLEGAPKSSFNVGLIEGGSSINAIAHTARAKVDIRSESNERMDGLVGVLSAAVDRARQIENERAAGGKIAGKLKEIGSRPAAALPDDAPILRYVCAVDAHLGIRSHLDCSSTDANIPLSLGVPAIAIGAGGTGGGAHTMREWYRPDGRDLGLKRILLLLLLLMRDSGSPPSAGSEG